MLTIKVNGFKNPASTCDGCDVSFTCEDSGDTSNSYTTSYVATAAALSGIAVTADPASTVAGYYPLTIGITPNTSLPLNGRIAISELVLQNAGADCSGYITQSTMLASFKCSYSGKTATLVASGFSGSLAELNSSYTIILAFDKVQYNTKMSAKDLIVTLRDSAGYDIEAGAKLASWAPAGAATFASLSFAFQSDSTKAVSGSASVAVKFQLSAVNVSSAAWAAIEFFSAGTDAQSLSCLQLGNTTATGTAMKGNPPSSSGWKTSQGNISLAISGLILPSSERPFKARITIYNSSVETSGEIVYQQNTTELSAVRGTTLIVYPLR